MIVQFFKILGLVFFLVGCKNESSNSKIRIHIPEVKIVLNPQQMEDAYSMMITSQLYRGLLRYSPTGDVVPDLAASWEESSDRLKYTFKLKENTFSDGKPITSRNVQMSFAKLFYDRAGMAADIDYIEGALEFSKSKDLKKLGIRIINDKEIEFRLSRPSALFLKQLAVVDCSILPIEKYTDDVNALNDGVFSGPFKIVSHDKKSFVLDKWRKDVFDSKMAPKEVLFFISNEDPIGLAKQGLTDTLDRDAVSNEDKTYFKKNGWGIVPTELTGETFVILNPKHIKEKIRKTLFKKLNSASLIKSINEPHFSPAYGLIPTGFQSELTESETNYLRSNIDEYLGPKVFVDLDYDPSSDLENKIATYLKQVWDSKSVEIVLKPMTKSEKLERMFLKKSVAVLGRKGIDYPDGYSVLTYFKGKYQSNFFFVNDTSIDEDLLQVVSDFDESSRAKKYKGIQKKILEKYTIVPLFFGSQASGLWSARVKNAPSHPLGYHTVPFESIEMRGH